MNRTFQIGTRKIGLGHPCFVIAEMSCNHRQSYEQAVEIVHAAAAAGADAVKLQTYTADTLTIDSDKPYFLVEQEEAPESWKKQNLHALYREAYTPWEWHAPLKKLAEGLGLVFFSTPFDESAVDYLENLQVPCYKVASYEATHIPLLRRIARTGKPVIISVGFATLEEVELAVDTLRSNGTNDIAVLHCVTSYSGTPEPQQMRLSTIADIRERFSVVSGFSDNNGGVDFPAIAVASGASIVEKHLLINKEDGGHDARFSLDACEFKTMVTRIRNVQAALGQPNYGPSSATEEKFRQFRRSVFVVEDMAAGEVFNRQNIRVIRPAHGLPPSSFDSTLGKRAAQPIERGTPLSWELVEPGNR
jgi:pseudaminic acid synthase